MRKRKCVRKAALLGMAGMFLFCSCTGKSTSQEAQEPEKAQQSAAKDQTAGQAADSRTADSQAAKQKSAGLEVKQADWSKYFNGLQGAAVILDTSAERYTVFHKKLANTRRSPCSTFKVVSSMIALEHGLLDPAHSVRQWSGETFWKDTWNQDLDFQTAFRESCVWYFREVADEIGKDLMQAELDRLMYGNCDISDWEGRLNTNNNNRALTGFWIESSLTISPKEQTEVMERIFGERSIYQEQTRNELKKVMLVEQSQTDAFIYGKTGMGMEEGVVVDAWFSGFADKSGRQIYFCVYLGRTDGADVSSTAAKEIAVRLVGDYLL